MENRQTNQVSQSQRPITKPPKKGCFNFRNCCLTCVVVFLVFALIILIILSLSGLVWIPGLSHLFYGSGPEPLKEVKLNSLSDDYIEKRIEGSKKAQENKIVFTEEELTYFINNYAQENASLENKDEASGQVVIEDDFVELYLHKTRGFRDAIFWADIAEDGEVRIKKIRIGKMPVPVFVGNIILTSFLHSYGSPSENILGDYDIELREGEVEMNLEPFNKDGGEPPIF